VSVKSPYDSPLILHGIEFREQDLQAACARAGVTRLWLFGAILTDRFHRDRDIDVPVETDPRRPVGLLAPGELPMHLSAMFGRRVHLTTLAGVPNRIRAELLAGARRQDAS
jgi:predicted nucleotidyltransferase